jgi:peroxiredoxin
MAKSLLSERMIIPSFCLEGREGLVFDSQDFKRNKNLILYFVSQIESDFLVKLEDAQPSLRAQSAETAVISSLPIFRIEDIYKKNRLSFSILSDSDRVVLAKFLKTEPFETYGALFITNKNGELFFKTVVSKIDDLPLLNEVVQSLRFIESQ